MLYNTDIKKGAHVVFFRESCAKIRDTQSRLYKEAQYYMMLVFMLMMNYQNFIKE
jgi:predicted RNase H-related nuclease YkuK (DUF458 family)